jgi:hypothetical protein
MAVKWDVVLTERHNEQPLASHPGGRGLVLAEIRENTL